MGAPLTRQQRCAMQRHAAEADRAVEGDRRFFARHTERRYRVRPLSRAERTQLETFRSRPLDGPPGHPVPCTAMKALAPGVRLRVTIFGSADVVGEEMPENEACALFEAAADRNPALRQREALLLDAMRGPGGPLHNQGGSE